MDDVLRSLDLTSAGRLDVEIRQTRPVPLDVKFSCAPGELLALVGPSGSGKTTVLRSIAGLVPTISGYVVSGSKVWFDSSKGVHVKPQDRHIGLVFQDYALFPHLSALDNVRIAMRHRAEPQASKDARALIAKVNLEGLEERRPDQLSGGQRQRVALARALAGQPRVLLLDEPFSAVDQPTRDRLKRELATLRGKLKIPIILVTHDIGEALALADRISVLYHGSTLETGSPEAIRLTPSSPIVARLMGQTNLFPGRLEAAAEGSSPGRLAWANGTLEIAKTGTFKAGDLVTWLAPSDHVVLHRRDRPSLGERENPVHGRISEFVVLGEQCLVTLQIDGNSGAPLMLNFKVSTHAARRNGLAVGERAAVSLLASGLHLMPRESK